MTRKFKRAVKGVVADGVITPVEKENLDKLAKEEEESQVEIDIYITKELKKRKNRIASGGNWFTRNAAVILPGVLTLGGIALKAVLEGKGKS